MRFLAHMLFRFGLDWEGQGRAQECIENNACDVDMRLMKKSKHFGEALWEDHNLEVEL